MDPNRIVPGPGPHATVPSTLRDALRLLRPDSRDDAGGAGGKGSTAGGAGRAAAPREGYLPEAPAGCEPKDLSESRIHFVDYGGSGPRVLLLHAIGLDKRSWTRVAPYLQDHYHLVAVDLPGHGESDKPLAVDYSLTSIGRRMLRFMDQLGWDDAILIGNSMGGGTSLAMTLQAPERIRALALLNSVGFRRGLPPIGVLAAVPFLPHVSGFVPPLAMRLGLELVRSGRGSISTECIASAHKYFRSPEGATAFFRALRQLYGPTLDEMSPRYGRIRCPTLVLHGERDPLIFLRHAERLAAAIPTAGLIRVPRCGHFPQEEYPERVGTELRRFLDRVSASGSVRSPKQR